MGLLGSHSEMGRDLARTLLELRIKSRHSLFFIHSLILSLKARAQIAQRGSCGVSGRDGVGLSGSFSGLGLLPPGDDGERALGGESRCLDSSPALPRAPDIPSGERPFLGLSSL